ncbi:MAG: helicase-related protein [Candidatus Heimdallarchaeaceae archaeon]
MHIESREYQNFIIEKISELTKKMKSVILELDCGMGKRVLIYRLLKEIFFNKKVVIFLQTHSSLEETRKYLEEDYGGIEKLTSIRSGQKAEYRKYLIENNKIILSLPIVFSNTLKKFPEIAEKIDVIIINEVDQIVRRVSQKRVLCIPWNLLLKQFYNSFIIGMSGTLRDKHWVLDENQLHLRNELKTLLEFIPNSTLISIEDFMDTDIEKHIKYTEIHIYPIRDSRTAKIINKISEMIENIKEQIKQEVRESSPQDVHKIEKNFFQNLPLISVETELLEKLNRFLLLRKYVYSMPVGTYKNHLVRYDFDKNYFQNLPKISGKERETLKLIKKYQKSTVLCSFLSTVSVLSELVRKEGFEVFHITGKTKNKNEVLKKFKKTEKRSVLILSPIGERDLDIPQTEIIIIFDLVNSPKTVYQKLKRGRGGKVFLLFYDETPEKEKVRRVTSEIAIRYPWSLIFAAKKS